jgi:hypothetical protein
VVAPETAVLVRQELIGVVQNGTGRRALRSIVLANGKIIPVGGKTGTGDNRLETFSASGYVIGSKVVSRTAIFVFMVGDRLYGTVIAYVPGPKAASYRFTSALAVQIFKDLAPQIRPLFEQSGTRGWAANEDRIAKSTASLGSTLPARSDSRGDQFQSKLCGIRRESETPKCPPCSSSN